MCEAVGVTQITQLFPSLGPDDHPCILKLSSNHAYLPPALRPSHALCPMGPGEDKPPGPEPAVEALGQRTGKAQPEPLGLDAVKPFPGRYFGLSEPWGWGAR